MTAVRAREQRWWMAVPLVLSLLPVLDLFTTTRIFYVRDLSFFFWSRHLWLRHTIFSGQWPWWDPYVASGQSAIADALNQLAMPLTLAIRLLPSDVVSFNLWVALPLPIAALGMYVFLSRRFAPGPGHAAAAFGACVFALSGPIVSMLNTPNLAWSVALVPWVLAGESVAWIAIAFGLQALCGEPVTWAATGVLAACWIVSRRDRRVHLLAGLALGALLASVQLVPTMMASVRAHRGALATPDFWSLHPLSLWEALAPHLFGNYYDAFLADLPWMGTLNFGRDPFFYSIYVGPLVLLLACAGAGQVRRNGFWVAVAAVFVLAALGGYTPAYPWLRRLVPALMYFRFPVKYIVFAVFAVAILAAEGWKAWTEPSADGGRYAGFFAALAGALVIAVTLALMALPQTLGHATFALAVATHLKDPAAGGEVLARVAPPLALRAGAMLLAAALLIALARRRPYAWWLLAGVTCADLLAVNAGLNPTTGLVKLSPPGWFTAAAGSQRLYIGGRVRGYMNADDPDAAPTWQIPAESTAIEGRMELNADLPMAPSGWRVREALSYDLPYLWPAEYEATVKRFERASRDERDAFLRRTGVRWCVLPPPRADLAERSGGQAWRAIADVPDWSMRVYDCHPAASRVAFAAEPGAPEDLFDPGRPDGDAAGDARITEDLGMRVTIETTVTRRTHLVLRDSYDPSWRADVDGRPVPILRAFGLQRAVALTPGRHVVRFSYRPRDLLVGLTLTVTTVLLIGFSGFSGFHGFSGFGVLRVRARRTENRENPMNPRNPENPERGFTLIELMVVLAIIAILLAIAFTAYRNMQARGNEASALSSMRSIAAAQWQFATTCGNMKYATTLPGLGQPVPATGQPFLSPDLTAGETFEKSGYMIGMAGKPLNDAMPACNGAAVADGYKATADPVKPGVSGAYYYGVNADRVLYLDAEKSFKDDLPETGAAPHGGEVK